MKLKKVPVLDMFGYIEGFECPSKNMHKTRAMETLKRIYPGIKKADGYQLKFVSDL